MNRIRTAFLSSVMLLGVGSAFAQDTVIIAPEQETVIREYVVKNPGTVVEVPQDYSLSVGGTIPEDVTLVPVDVPESAYDYVNIGGRTAIVDRSTRRVVEIID